MQHKAVLDVLSRCGGPAGLRKAGQSKLLDIVRPKAPRMGEPLVEQIFAALGEQTVTVPGTAAAEKILPKLADSLRDTPGHLAAYAGPAPVTRRSGTSIRGEHPPKGGNKQLKRAFFLAAFASLSHPPSRTYYDRKRAQGKRHNAALICLARRRVDVLFAMLRDREPYQTRPLEHALAA